ncbi:MAG: hypothetical protein ACYTGX_00735 [Planctomycetota bacterium]|jgi:hypothetical protein
MKLLVRFDDAWGAGAEDAGRPAALDKPDVPEAAAYFSLVWEHDGGAFPFVGHCDFGAEVLGQWILATRELIRGTAETVEFNYIEGGHALRVSRVDPDGDAVAITPEGVEPAQVWPTTTNELAHLLLSTARAVCDHLEEQGLAFNDRAALETDVESLEELTRGA